MKEIKLWCNNLSLKIKLIVVRVFSELIKVYFKIFKSSNKHALLRWALEIENSPEEKLIKGAITKFPEEFSHILNAPEHETEKFVVKKSKNGYFIDFPFGNYYIRNEDVKVATADPHNPISDRDVLTKQEEVIYEVDKAIVQKISKRSKESDR